MTFDKSIENVEIRIDFDSVEVDSIVFKYQITRSSFGLFVNLSKRRKLSKRRNLSKTIETSKSIEKYRNLSKRRKISKDDKYVKNFQMTIKLKGGD